MWYNSGVFFVIEHVQFWNDFGAILDPFGSPPWARNLSKRKRKADKLFG